MSALNQYAALPYVITPEGVLVCLVTSRGTGRWIVPKGWPKAGHDNHHMAAREAREEGGLLGTISDTAIGTFSYRKKLHTFARAECQVTLFPLLVDTQCIDWREKSERKVVWLSPKKAAKRVDEAGLAKLIAALPEWIAQQQRGVA